MDTGNTEGGVRQVVLKFGKIGGLGLDGEGIAGIQLGGIVILRKYKDPRLTPPQPLKKGQKKT